MGLRTVVAVVGGLLVAIAGGMFLLIGGPGIVHGLLWVATHAEVEWLDAGRDRAQLDEIHVPAAGPPAPPLSELHFPDGRGRGQGGTPMVVTRRHGAPGWIGIYTEPAGGDRGAILDAERRVVEPFTLQGGTSRNVDLLVMPTAGILLVVGTDRLPDGRYLRRLDEYDLRTKARIRRIAEEMFGYGVLFTRADDVTSVVVYATGELAMGMNMQRPKYSTVRVYSPRLPGGGDVVRIGYGIGEVRALAAERPDRLVLLTRFDHGLAPRSPTDRAWALTLR